MPDARLSRWEKIAFAVVLLLALVSRFYMLDARAISHDESIHTKFSWNLYSGSGFQHNPMMHGPSLFEFTALNYFLFGVNDFSARIFAALTGVALVFTPLLFRKWLGRWGAWIACLLLLISPSISYYSRYIRHDVPLMLIAMLLLWTIFKYLDVGTSRWLYALAAIFALMYATKEDAYLYTAIFGGLLFLPFVWQVLSATWERADLFRACIIMLVVVLLLVGVFGVSFRSAQVEEKNLDAAGNTRVSNAAIPWWGRIAIGLALLAGLVLMVVMYYGVGQETMASIRLFDVLMTIGTLTLPLGAAFLISYVAGVDMGKFYDALMSNSLTSLPGAELAGAIAVTVLSLIASVALGLWWGRERRGIEEWGIIALIHYSIFFVLYTTFFTNGLGVLSGMIGGLAYWMAQQGVARGGQPWYYYFIIGPLYEYLPILFSLGAGVAALMGLRPRTRDHDAASEIASLAEEPLDLPTAPPLDLARFLPVFTLGWMLLAWAVYTIAGEKMPWLLVFIALPSILLSAWWLGRMVEDLSAGLLRRDPDSDAAPEVRAAWLFVLALPLLVTALAMLSPATGRLLAALRGGVPEAGPMLPQLEALGAALGALVGVVVFGWLLSWNASRLLPGAILRLSALVLALFLGLLTLRTMWMVNFINYDLATEFLVYAHGTPDIKVALRQVDEISWRVTGAPHDVKVAYGEDGSWPLTWYMALYPNAYFYSTSPDQTKLLECPVVIAGKAQYDAVQTILGDAYVAFDYKYLWWPIQDYFDMTWERILNTLRDPEWRAAVWDIIWDRDYIHYAQLANPQNPFTLQKWPHRQEFRLYVRADLAAEVWNYRLGSGVAAQTVYPVATTVPDPYIAGLRSDLAISSVAALPEANIQGLAVAPDGSLYVTHVGGHRIWRITPQGAILGAWGEYGAGAGQFNEPWGVALDAKGNVYTADTWNHRVQKLTAQGAPLTQWGLYGMVNANDPAGHSMFFGPRGIAVGEWVYVTDTGNKRVQVFTLEGQFVREFGGSGATMGLMNEPVGIAVGSDGAVYVADTWNHRVQVFTADGLFMRQWSVPVWGSDNPQEKPFLALDDADNVYVSDPLHRRVLAFAATGEFLWALDGFSEATTIFLPAGLAVNDGVLYVADAQSGRVTGFRLPE